MLVDDDAREELGKLIYRRIRARPTVATNLGNLPQLHQVLEKSPVCGEGGSYALKLKVRVMR